MAAKSRKNTLEIDYSYNFELLGVRSTLKGYRLAWVLNQLLHTRLMRQKDLVLHYRQGVEGSYHHFVHHTPLNHLHLFRNKPLETDKNAPSLVPEYPHFDFILMTQSEENMSGNRLQEYLRNIPSVELVTLIPLATLKSKDNFIF